MILLIDNYDSFAHNLARYLRRLDQTVRVVRNDRITAGQVTRSRPSAVVLSPGPGTPSQAGCCIDVVRACRVPLLGVCLGHQAIAAAYGARVIRAREPVHGRASMLHHEGTGLFRGLPPTIRVGRYHSLVVDRTTLPSRLRVDAWLEDGTVMGIADQDRRVFGLQFHPESVLTECGFAVLANFLQRAGLPFRVPLPDETRERGCRNEVATSAELEAGTPLTF